MATKKPAKKRKSPVDSDEEAYDIFKDQPEKEPVQQEKQPQKTVNQEGLIDSSFILISFFSFLLSIFSHFLLKKKSIRYNIKNHFRARKTISVLG